MFDSKGVRFFDYGPVKYDADKFRKYLDQSKISETQRSQAISLFKGIAPKICVQIVENSKSNSREEFYQTLDYRFKRCPLEINNEGRLVVRVLIETYTN